MTLMNFGGACWAEVAGCGSAELSSRLASVYHLSPASLASGSSKRLTQLPAKIKVLHFSYPRFPWQTQYHATVQPLTSSMRKVIV